MSTSAICVNHEDRQATKNCERCGDFICDDCERSVLKKQVCVSCTEINGVRFLDAYKDSVWGKRDGFVWLFGAFGSLINFSQIFIFGAAWLTMPSGKEAPIYATLTAISTIVFVINVSYFLLKPWSRAALFVGPLLWTVAETVMMDGDLNSYNLGRSTGSMILPLLFIAGAFSSARNKLAFKIDITERQLEKLYKTYVDNQTARYSLLLGVLSLLIPPLAILSLIMAIVGLRRVDPNAWPPIGGRGNAIAGLVFSCLSLLFYASIFAYSVM